MLLRQSDACVRRNRTVSEKMRIEDLVDQGDGTGRMCALTPDGHVWLEIHRIAIFAVPFLDRDDSAVYRRTFRADQRCMAGYGGSTDWNGAVSAARRIYFANKERMKIDNTWRKKYVGSKYKNHPAIRRKPLRRLAEAGKHGQRRYREN